MLDSLPICCDFMALRAMLMAVLAKVIIAVIGPAGLTAFIAAFPLLEVE